MIVQWLSCLWWRLAFHVSGGLTRVGALPAGGCVVVANGGSAADAPALLAALGPARRLSFQVAEARAVRGMPRPGPAPRRRDADGSAEVTAGRVLVLFDPDAQPSAAADAGDRVRQACELAVRAQVPVVPVGIGGADRLLDASGGLRPHPVAVRVGRAMAPDAAAVRQAVGVLAAAPVPVADSQIRLRLAAFAGTSVGLLVMAAWALGEALVLPLLPEFALAILAVAAPRRAVRLALAAVVGSIAGGALMYALAAHGVSPPAPLTTPRMHAVAAQQVSVEGAAALRHQTMSGVPYKVYGQAAGRARVGLEAFVLVSVPARSLRILMVSALAGVIGWTMQRWRRWYPTYLLLFVAVFAAGLSAVVRSWS
jgi:1-acyl-sn-glycerol-3-phosphate acyltransferase